MGSASMIIDLKSGSYGANVMVGAMAFIIVGSIVAFCARHVWLRCTGAVGNAVGSDNRQHSDNHQLYASTTTRRSVPLGARLCDSMLFGDVAYDRGAKRRAGANDSGRDLRLLI